MIGDYGYNGLFQLTKVTLPEPAPGQPRPEWNYQVNSGGLLLRATDPEGRFTEYACDGAGRLDQVQVGGVGVLTTMLADYGYDGAGNLRFTTDPAGQVTERVYDARNRLTQLIEPDPDLPGSGQAAPVTLFTYDDANNLQTLTDPTGNATEWFYDGLDRVVEERNELADSRFYEYDAQTRLVSMTDRLGRVTQYVYDWLGNVTSEIWLDALGATVRGIDYTYDQANRLETVLDPSGGSYTFTYDGLDRLATSMIFTPGVSGFTGASAAYDALGNRTDLDVYRGFTLEHANDYQYDSLSRLTRVTQSEGGTPGSPTSVAEKRVDFTYNLAGQFDTIARYADLAGTTLVAESDFTYDPLGRLQSLVHDVAAVGEPDLTHSWTYDTRHRVASYTNSVDGQVTYNYDHRSQLEGANRPGTSDDELYDYDDAGNRTLDGAATYTVGANNRLLFDGTYRYDYDAEGNRTARYVDADESESLNSGDTDVTLYSWDHRNRLTKVEHRWLYESAADEIVKYLYDAFDRRVGKNLDSDGDGTDDRRERYVYDGPNVILDFVDPDGAGAAPMALAKRYLHGPAVDMLLAQEDLSQSISAAERVLWPLADNQGTTRDLVDSTGAVVEHYVFGSFGEILEGDATRTRYLWTGREWDADVELNYHRARWTDVVVGSWLSQDGGGFHDGYNLYAYVGNSPTNATDPSGLQKSCGCEWVLVDLRYVDFRILGDGPVLWPTRTYDGPSMRADLRTPLQRYMGQLEFRARYEEDVLDHARAIDEFLWAQWQYADVDPTQRYLVHLFAPLQRQPGLGGMSLFEQGLIGSLGVGTGFRGFAGTGTPLLGRVQLCRRSAAARSEYLRSLAGDYRTPSWMKPWLMEGQTPPGYHVDHIIPLSIGGPDTALNMRLQGADLHRLWHRQYRPWRK